LSPVFGRITWGLLTPQYSHILPFGLWVGCGVGGVEANTTASSSIDGFGELI